MSRTQSPKHVLCVSNQGYRASLIVRRVHALLPDEEAAAHGMVRIIDESGEDYLFPKELFVSIKVPPAATRLLRDEPAYPPRRTAQSRRR